MVIVMVWECVVLYCGDGWLCFEIRGELFGECEMYLLIIVIDVCVRLWCGGKGLVVY